jgi:hypothetical protein
MCSAEYLRADIKSRKKEGSFLRDDRAGLHVDRVGHGPVEQVERVDLHIHEFLVIERLELLLPCLVPGDHDTVLHLPAAGDVVHTVRWKCRVMKVTKDAIFGMGWHLGTISMRSGIERAFADLESTECPFFRKIKTKIAISENGKHIKNEISLHDYFFADENTPWSRSGPCIYYYYYYSINLFCYEISTIDFGTISYPSVLRYFAFVSPRSPK